MIKKIRSLDLKFGSKHSLSWVLEQDLIQCSFAASFWCSMEIQLNTISAKDLARLVAPAQVPAKHFQMPGFSS